MKKTTYTLLAISAVALAASSLLSSCVKENPDSPGFEYMPDMYRSPSIETNGINKWVKDSTQMGNMLPAEGSIPRGFTPFPYPNTPDGDTLASKFWNMPTSIPHNDSIEAQGKFLFERFCVYCHGDKGDGQGKLVASGKYTAAVPNYADRKAAGWLTDGHVYFVITYGIRNMGSHGSQLNPEERWKVIEYVQRLGRGGKPWSESPGCGLPAETATDTTKAKTPTVAVVKPK